jgi:hypothetical protein
VAAKAITSFDCLVASLFRSFYQFRLGAISIAQLQLSVSFGGIGLRSARYHSYAAFYASLGSALPLIGKVIGRFPSFSYECLDSIRADVTPFLPSDFKLDCFEQGKISRALESRQFQNLLATSSPLEKARLIAAARPRAGSFLNVVPNAALGTILQSAEFNVAVAYRIGSPILPNPTVCPARNCDKTLDIYGHHAVRCKAQGDITHRHHRIRDLIYKKCQSALLQPLLEPIGM